MAEPNWAPGGGGSGRSDGGGGGGGGEECGSGWESSGSGIRI